MADRRVEVEHWECFECDQEIEVRRIGHPHPEAPDFFAVPPGCFITCMTVDDDEDPEAEGEEQFIVCCSAKCTQTMLENYDLPKTAE